MQSIVSTLMSTEALSSVAEHLGLQHLVRTAEFPPTQDTLADALKVGISDLFVLSSGKIRKRSHKGLKLCQ